MKPKTKKRLKIVGIVLLASSICLTVLFMWGAKYLIRQHQLQLISELKQWEAQYSSVNSTREAIAAIEMYDYAKYFYEGGEGSSYYSDRKTMLAVREQRAKTLNAIVQALETFTGLHYGHDYAKWQEWKNAQLQDSKQTQDGNSQE